MMFVGEHLGANLTSTGAMLHAVQHAQRQQHTGHVPYSSILGSNDLSTLSFAADNWKELMRL